MVVVIQTVFAEVRDIDIWPTVIVIVGDSNAEAPPVVGDTRLRGNIREGAIVIIVKQRCLWSRCFSTQSLSGRTVGKINIKPAIIVVVDQANARAVALDNVRFLGSAHGVLPGSQA